MLTKYSLIVLFKLSFLLGDAIKRDAIYQRWEAFGGRMWDKSRILFANESVSLIHCAFLCKSRKSCVNYFYITNGGVCTGSSKLVVNADIEHFGYEAGSALYIEFDETMKQEMKKKSDGPFDKKTESDIHDELSKVSSPQTTEDADMSEPPFITTTETTEVKFASTDVGTAVTTLEMKGPKYYTVHNAQMEFGQVMCDEVVPGGHLVWIENKAENEVVGKLLQEKKIKRAFIGLLLDTTRNYVMFYPSKERATYTEPLLQLNAKNDNSVHCLAILTDDLSWVVESCNATLDGVCEQK